MSHVCHEANMAEVRALTSAYGDRVAEAEDGRRFGALLREYRLAAKLTQEDVAERSGVSLSTINRWERVGPARPELEDIRAVCRVVKLSTVLAGLALGLLAPEDVEHLPEPPGPADPREATALEILRDPEVPDSLKESAYQYLAFLRNQVDAQRPGAEKPRAAS